MKYLVYSYNNSDRIIDKNINAGIEKILTEIEFNFKVGSSRELRDIINEKLSFYGWSDKITLESNTNISITSFNKEHGLCLQTGNMSRFYADLLKLEYLFQKKKITCAFYIIPTNEAAKLIGSNVANFERFTNELNLFSTIITIPLRIFGIKN